MKRRFWLMLAHSLPVLIMFLYTTLTVSLFFIPITRFPRKNKLANFYWVGFWTFLVMIAAFAGGDNTLKILGYNASGTSKVILAGISTSFVFFVMFAWFRFSAKIVARLITRGYAKLRS